MVGEQRHRLSDCGGDDLLKIVVTARGTEQSPIFFADQPPFDQAAESIIRMISQNNSVRIWCAKGIHMDHTPTFKHDKEAGEILCKECGEVFKSGTYGQK
jgi:hypothetical protein